MSDHGALYADRTGRVLELRFQRTFTEAQSDILKKLDRYTERFQKKDKEMRSKRDKGLITDGDYQDWVNRHVFMGAQWEQKVKDIDDTLLDYYSDAMDKVHDRQIDVFTKNANYQAYCMEHDIGKNFGFDLYDVDTVERLVKETPELLPRKIVNRKKHNHWNQGIITNCITQGVIQGESIPKIARRIANTTANHNMKSATMYARTAMTSAQNGGRMQMLKDAKAKGINVKKHWLAIVDGRTRDSHKHLNGQIRDVDKPFKSDYGRIDFPGDPHANPADVYNCRCTLTYVYPEYDDMSQYPDWEEAKKMTYPEWENEKKRKQGEEQSKNIFGDKIQFSEKMDDEKWDEAKGIIGTLATQFKTKLKDVLPGSVKSAGSVEISGTVMRLSSKKVSDAIHEFAHTISRLDQTKLGLYDEQEFWDEIRKVRTKYRKAVSNRIDMSISTYADSKRDLDEFMAEGFALGYMRENGIPVPDKYGNDTEFSAEILRIVRKYFGK